MKGDEVQNSMRDWTKRGELKSSLLSKEKQKDSLLCRGDPLVPTKNSSLTKEENANKASELWRDITRPNSSLIMLMIATHDSKDV